MLIGTIYVLVLVLASRSTKNPLDIKNHPHPLFRLAPLCYCPKLSLQCIFSLVDVVILRLAQLSLTIHLKLIN